MTIDTTYFQDVDTEVLSYINKVLPIDGGIMGTEYSQPDGSMCSVILVSYTATTSTSILTLNKEYIKVDKDNVSSTATVVADVAGTVIVKQPPSVPEYQVRVYKVVQSLIETAWTFLGIVT